MTARGGDHPGFFIVGCPRSGTTLLAVLLDRHSRLAVPPETGFFDEVAPRLRRGDAERLLKVLRRWRRLPELQLAAEDVVRRVADAAARRADEGRWEAADVLAAILTLYRERHGKARSGEKTPQHLMHVPAIRSAFPEAPVLCLLRDGRDNALSLRAMPWWPGGLTAAAKLWTRCVQLMERFAEEHPRRFRIVRYEDLASRPEPVLRDVLDFLGETFEPEQLAHRPSTTILPRSAPWKGSAAEAIEPERATRRRREASPRDVAALEHRLQRDLARLGYLG